MRGLESEDTSRHKTSEVEGWSDVIGRVVNFPK